MTEAYITNQKQNAQHNATKSIEMIFDCVRFLGEQGLPLREHSHDDGNLERLVDFMRLRDSKLDDYMNATVRNDYCSWSSQNEILSILAQDITDRTLQEVKQSRFFGIMADECTDKGVMEQLSLCIRYVTHDLLVHEEWLCFETLMDTSAEIISTTLKNLVASHGLSMENCRAQGYDGASNMRGARGGVKTKILAEYPLATFSYCSGHNLNLIVKDASSSHEWLIDAIESLEQTVYHILWSPRRKASFKSFMDHFNEEMEGLIFAGLRPLCPTRWTIRGPAISSFLEQYGEIIDWLADQTNDTTVPAAMKSKARSLINQLHKFRIYYSLRLLDSLCLVTNPVHTKIQSHKMSVQRVRRMIEGVSEILSMKNSHEFAVTIFDACVAKTIDLQIEQPTVRRGPLVTRRRGQMVEMEVDASVIVAAYNNLYEKFHNEALQSILVRYPDEELIVLQEIEEALCTPGATAAVSAVFERYKDDLSDGLTRDIFGYQITILHNTAAIACMDMVKLSVESLAVVYGSNDALAVMKMDAHTMLRIYLVAPATTCSPERSFSALKRIKTYLRTTMTEAKLNHCATLHIRKAMCKTINMQKAVDSFIIRSTARRNLFGAPEQTTKYWTEHD